MPVNFGTQRPGSAPPPRQPLTAEDILYREKFTRASHLAQNASAQPGQSAQSPPPNPASPVVAFDEVLIREALRREGMDFTFQIFPLGAKPPEGTAGANQHREQRLAELESERTVMRTRMLAAESAAAGAIKELGEFKAKCDNLQREMELLKALKTKKSGAA